MDRNVATPPPTTGRRQRGMRVVKPKDMKGSLRRILWLTKGSRKGLGWILMLSGLASLSSVLSPLLIGKAVNQIDGGNPVMWLLALLAGLYVADWLVRFLQQFFMASIGQKMILNIRTGLFSAVKNLPLSFFDRSQHGELMSRLTNDVDTISTTISDSLTHLMMYGFTILGIFFIMLYENVILTCVALLAVIMILILTRVITRQTRKLFKKQQVVLGKLNGQIEESISGLSMIKAFGRESKVVGEFEENNEEFCEVATQALIWSGYLMPITNVINNLNYVLIAVVSGVMAANNLITVGMISSFLLYSRQFSRPFVEMANIYNNFQTAVAGAERIFEILDEEPEPPDVLGALSLDHPRGEIRLDHVTFGYDAKVPILKEVSLDIPAGTRVAVVGPTGAGKTTLISLLTRFYDVNEGSILLDGRDLREYKIESLRRAFGVVLQDTSLFGMSVRDNISYGRSDVPFEKIREAAVTAGADSFIRRLPAGYETILHQGGTTLSQGERQLLTIARAILTDAPILILDEATSSVDTMTEQKIRKAMLGLTKGRTSFIIAHRLSTIRYSDIILLIEDGHIAEQGTHEELMEMDGKYASMYKTQLGIQ
ncbi:MAG TPA: ABC transporter ATP-binding protein [Candidatus Pelethocola excrementipullorum]|nr:ABC transporter ATP-binding protein [Candidatus Pelethocola excrementipullorum]